MSKKLKLLNKSKHCQVWLTASGDIRLETERGALCLDIWQFMQVTHSINMASYNCFGEQFNPN